jgi:predicted metal-dependent HD superfamily phosphohydrolase
MTSPGSDQIDGLDRFQALWQRCLIPGTDDHSASIYQCLVAAYGEAHRHYHTLTHIRHCLQQLDLSKALLGNPDTVEISIWFHDAVYQSGTPDNEKRSAQLYRELALDHHHHDFCQQVEDMIVATIHAETPPDRADELYMVDIDLSSFGLSWDDFLRDSRHLRLESPHLSDSDYNRRQGNFRKSLLKRERFFYTDYFYQQFEAQARDNLERYFEQKSE